LGTGGFKGLERLVLSVRAQQMYLGLNSWKQDRSSPRTKCFSL